MTGRVVPVGVLAAYVREVLEADAILGDLWVEGEVSHLIRAQSGHVYFTVRDQDASLKCVLFKPLAARQRLLPQPGMQVAVHGRVSLYPRDGAIQLYADVVQPAGLGLAALRLEQLRQRLEAEGIFEPSRKRPLPYAPRAIGVVTSADGAVWHDIQHVLRRRYPLTELILAAAPVQGETAPAGLVAALQAIQAVERVEVVILARGGGSPEDLAAFNDEAVVRAVFACRVPVVTGVGHETDWTLADLAADVRAPTPSAAAEICVPALIELADRVAGLGERLSRALHHELVEARRPVGQARIQLRRLSPATRLRDERRRLTESTARLTSAERARLHEARAALTGRQQVLGALEPQAVLLRGYVALRDAATGGPLGRVAQATTGQSVIAELADGQLAARIEHLAPTRPDP